MSGPGCLTDAGLPSYPRITVWTESARVTAKMVVHPGREGVDAGAEFLALGLDGSGQVASLSLDGSRQVAYLCLDAGILSVDPGALCVDPVALSVDSVALSVNPGVQTRSERIDPGPKIEETA